MPKRPHSAIQPRRIALLLERTPFMRNLARGVRSYIRSHEPWSVYLLESELGSTEESASAKHAALSRSMPFDGIIAHIENPRITKLLKMIKKPVIDLSSMRCLPKAINVETDEVEVGRMAATHLIERGFKLLAYCGDIRFPWSEWRGDSFQKAAADSGYACESFATGAVVEWGTAFSVNDKALMAWLLGLPKPVGIMACHDFRAWDIIWLCHRLGIAVPDEVAVLGVDNDETVCDFAEPTLSSVIPNTEKIGYVAAETLDRMMNGEKIGTNTITIPPSGVITRQSTDVLATADENVSLAVRFIRKHACDGINVYDVLRVVPLSRRVLEQRFRRVLGRTPHEEINRTQLSHAAMLLVETDLSVADVADRAGFQYSEYMSSAFRRAYGIPPSEYRKKHRST